MMKNASGKNALALILIGAGALSAQTTQINANIRGGGSGDSGKCTIEVEVDQSAEVEIRGSGARMRTLSGSPASFRRMDCTSALPPNPANFRFSGVDGRGRQELVRDPQQNGGTAVVRIDDSQGGREGYTFDISWAGGGYSSNNNGYPNNGNNGYPNNRNSGYPNNGNNGYPNNNGRPNNGGYGHDNRPGGYAYSDRNMRTRMAAMQNCQNNVASRIKNGNSYNNVQFTNTDVDDNRWRADRITGFAMAQRRGRDDRYEYSCSVDLNSGRVMDVNLNRR